MLRKIALYGLAAGFIVGAPMLAMMVLLKGRMPESYLLGYGTMLLALSLVFVAVKRRRDEDNGGVIKFLPAFGLGLGISCVAGILYCLAWEASLALSHTDFASGYAAMAVEKARAEGVSGERLAKLIADMELFKRQYANPFYRVPMTFAEIFPVGVLVSLISAGLLRNSRFLPARRT